MPKHILVVEDDQPLRHALSVKLEKVGYRVTQAPDGEAGMDAATNSHPDLILLDLLMPKLDGIGLLQRLRREEWGKDVPVIVLTNLNDVGKVQEAVANQAFDFLVKADWTLEQITAKVREKIGKP
jgi:two-component system, OmpR family, response regulator RpaB